MATNHAEVKESDAQLSQMIETLVSKGYDRSEILEQVSRCRAEGDELLATYEDNPVMLMWAEMQMLKVFLNSHKFREYFKRLESLPINDPERVIAFKSLHETFALMDEGVRYLNRIANSEDHLAPE